MAGLISLGGSMSANDGDKHPFLAAELNWLREAVRRDVPTLGICLGSQLLAKAFGAGVYKNPQAEIGWYQVELLPAAAEDCLFHVRAANETVFHWHNDTFDLPAGAIHLAQSPACRNQAFRIGPLAYGLQFHAEMVPELLDVWLNKHETDASERSSSGVDAAAIRAQAPASFPAMSSFSRCLLGRFAQLCREY